MSEPAARRLLWAAGAVALAAILFGAWTGWPVHNDSYFVGLIRELGPGSLVPFHPDRPLYGRALEALATAFGRSKAPYIAIALGSWLLLAWQTARLWSRLFPEERPLGGLAALLVMSPILVETQYSTVTLTLPVNLPVSLGLAGLLSVLRPPPEDRRWLGVGAAFTAAGIVVSEYGIATAAASIALLAVLRRYRAAAALLIGAAAGYAIFRMIADLHAMEFVDPSAQFPKVLREPGTAAANWISSIWLSIVGAWLSAAGKIDLDAGSRSTWIAAAVGVFFAVAVGWALLRESPAARERPARRIAALITAVMAGMLPVVLAARTPDQSSIFSRVRTPILVFAAAVVVAVTAQIVRTRYRAAAFAFLGFLAGYRVVDGAFDARRDQRLFEEVGDRLLPMVRSSTGLTVAVFPWPFDRNDVPHRVTFRWSDEDVKRAWVCLPDEALDFFGPRVACGDQTRLDLPPSLVHRTPARSGPIAHLLWIPFEEGAVGDPEPYCVGSGGISPEAAPPTR